MTARARLQVDRDSLRQYPLVLTVNMPVSEWAAIRDEIAATGVSTGSNLGQLGSIIERALDRFYRQTDTNWEVGAYHEKELLGGGD